MIKAVTDWVKQLPTDAYRKIFKCESENRCGKDERIRTIHVRDSLPERCICCVAKSLKRQNVTSELHLFHQRCELTLAKQFTVFQEFKIIAAFLPRQTHQQGNKEHRQPNDKKSVSQGISGAPLATEPELGRNQLHNWQRFDLPARTRWPDRCLLWRAGWSRWRWHVPPLRCSPRSALATSHGNRSPPEAPDLLRFALAFCSFFSTKQNSD